jgi:hypothetical protein
MLSTHDAHPCYSSPGCYRKSRDKMSLLFGVLLIFLGTLILFFYSAEILMQFNPTYARIDGSYLLLLSFGMIGTVVKSMCMRRAAQKSYGVMHQPKEIVGDRVFRPPFGKKN